MVRTVTPAEADRILRRIQHDLERPAELEHKYAEAVLIQARHNASGRPTPQASMAAQNMTVEGSIIRPSAGGPPAAVAGGSEFGSNIYRQFQASHNPRGYWLLSSGDSEAVQMAGDRALDAVLQKAVAGF